jgi:hypothetical protein
MSTVVYTKLKELEIHDKEIYEFGNWLRSFREDNKWSFDEETEEEEEVETEAPLNKEGNVMEYPWGDFSFVIIPDTDAHTTEAESIAKSLGLYERFDVEDSDRTFFVVK